MAIGEPAVDELSDSEDDEPVAPEEVDACDDGLCPDEPVIPWAVGRFGRDPGPTDGTRTGEVAPGADGVGTVGGWIAGAGTGTGTGTGGGLGGVTVTGGGFGTVTAGTVTVGVGTDVTVGTVSAGLAWGRASSTSIVVARITASVTAAAPRVQAPARFVSLSWTRLRDPLIATDTYPFL
jgi:hypothetical protein